MIEDAHWRKFQTVDAEKSRRIIMNELERQFFEAFNMVRGTDECPEITDQIFLELICILNNYGKEVWACNTDSLKHEILNKCIYVIQKMYLSPIALAGFKKKVQKLFEEE